MAKIQISKLNRRIKMCRTTSIPDGMGGSTDTDTLLYATWANVSQTSGKTLLLQGQDVEQNVYTVIIRYDKSRMPKTNDWMTFEGMRLKLIGQPVIIDEGQRKFLKFTVQTQDGRV